MGDKVTTRFFVVINEKGDFEIFKTDRFQLKPGWVATEVEISAPRSAFSSPPIPKVSIDVPEDALRRTFSATAESVKETS